MGFFPQANCLRWPEYRRPQTVLQRATRQRRVNKCSRLCHVQPVTSDPSWRAGQSSRSLDAHRDCDAPGALKPVRTLQPNAERRRFMINQQSCIMRVTMYQWQCQCSFNAKTLGTTSGGDLARSEKALVSSKLGNIDQHRQHTQ